jgi:hypothetical protein
MSEHQELEVLEHTGQTGPIHQPTEGECLEIAHQALLKLGDSTRFRTIPGIEFMPLLELRRLSTRGTILQSIVNEIAASGVFINQTHGCFMDVTGLNHHDLHDILCGCHGATITGTQAALNLQLLRPFDFQ